jgi:glycosyltransferase involved in cell wall biosynthesis
MVGYMLSAWSEIPDKPEFSLHDPRGPGHVFLSPFYLIRCLSQIAARRKQNPLLHVHVAGRLSTFRKMIVVFFSRLLGLRVVLHLHDYNYRAFCASLPSAVFSLVRLMFNSANEVIVLGNGDRRLMLDLFELDPKRVHVVSNAVPGRSRYSVDNRPAHKSPRILFLGNLSARKGVHDLLLSFSSDTLLKLDWHATLAGGGPDLAQFSKQVSALGLVSRVDLPGWCDSSVVRSFLESADILVLPSYDEGMAMSVLEGMSYGLAVVCTPVGALSEVIEHEVSGILIQPGDIPALVSALHRCIIDADLRQRLGKQAEEAFERRFDVRYYPERISKVYKAALAEDLISSSEVSAVKADRKER